MLESSHIYMSPICIGMRVDREHFYDSSCSDKEYLWEPTVYPTGQIISFPSREIVISWGHFMLGNGAMDRFICT